MGISTSHITIESSLEQFLHKLDKSPSTIRAYHTDIQQFITWLHANDIAAMKAHHITSNHIVDYLRYLTDQGLTGITCSRKLVSMHLFFTYLMHEGVILSSPTAKVKKPRKDRKPKYALRSDEFKRILSVAKENSRDYALLQLLFQGGIRVSDVIAICLPQLDVDHAILTLHRKGSKRCKIPLEKKTLHALQAYLSVRPITTDHHLFLNYLGQGIRIGGVRKMVEKYARRAGISKKITCHGLFFTCSIHSSVLGEIDFYPKRSLRNEHKRTPMKDMLLDTDVLRKLMEYTSL
jgi:site-specific recombinase XerD